MERSISSIKVWSWGRSDPNVPADVSTPGASVHTLNWGTPAAYFPIGSKNVNCSSDHFGNMNFIVNIDFC